MPTNYYDILGVRSDAPQVQIHEAYISALKYFHAEPDKGAESGARLAEVGLAYQVLKTVEGRRSYNISLGLPQPPERNFTPDPEEEEVGPSNWAEYYWPCVWLPRGAMPWVVGAFLLVLALVVASSLLE